MHTIRAESVPKVVTSCSSPSEAIAIGKRDSLSWLGKTSVESCFGETIEDAIVSRDRVLFRLASGRVVGIWCGENGVVSELLDCGISPAVQDAEVLDQIVEVWLGSNSMKLDRAGLVRNLAGKILKKMQMSGSVLFVCVSELPLLCFGVMRDLNDNSLFLFWSESD